MFVSTFTGSTCTPSIDIDTALGSDAGGTFTIAFPVIFLSVAVPSRYGLVEVFPVPCSSYGLYVELVSSPLNTYTPIFLLPIIFIVP